MGSGVVFGIVVLRSVALEGTLAVNCWVHSRDSGARVAGTGGEDRGRGTSAGGSQRCCMRLSLLVNAARCSRKVIGAEEQGKEGIDLEVVSAA